MRQQLDRLAAAAWPALEQVEVDGWLLRAAVSATGTPVTKRANSALALALSRTCALDEVTRFYRDRALPPTVLVSDPDLAARLDGGGWTPHSPTQCLTGPLPSGSASGVTVTDAPTEAWLACWWAVDGRGGEDELEVARGCLARIAAPAAYACIVLDGHTVAVGRGVVQDGWLGIFSMAVLPAFRRRGLAGRVLVALGCWGDEQGARSAYLLIEGGNTGARALYDGAGFTLAHDYHYRRLT